MKPVLVATAVLDREKVEQEDAFRTRLRRADLFIRLAVHAAHQVLEALEQAGAGIIPQQTGLFLGTGFGPMQTNFEVLDLIVDAGQTSPTLFSHSVFNAAAGYIAGLCNIRGPAVTLTDFSWPFFRALEQGWLALSCGALTHCLVLQVETYSDLLADARSQVTGKGKESLPVGAVAWLLAGKQPQARQAKNAHRLLQRPEITILPHAVESVLDGETRLVFGKEEIICPTPLAAVRELTTRLDRDDTACGPWVLSRSGKRVEVQLQGEGI